VGSLLDLVYRSFGPESGQLRRTKARMTSGLRHSLFRAAFAATAALKADRWLKPLAQGAGVILMFHHVRPWTERAFAPNRILEITPAFLDRTLTVLREMGFDLITLDGLPARLERGGPRPFAVLTFDDGYRDNVEHALPVLRRHKAPWTLFVTADFAAGTGRLWWLELEAAIARLDRVSIDVGGRRIKLACADPAAKARAFGKIYWRLRAGPEERLLAVIAGLMAQAGIDGSALVRSLCLGWDEIASLTREPGLAIGAHTFSHPMLAKHDDATARREIVASKAAIEERIRRPVRHFAYPVGDKSSAGPRDFSLAREAGFASAVTTRPGHVFPQHLAHLHALPRVSVNGAFQTEEALRGMLSGVPFLAWNRGKKVNVG
jgi:peptidoglycan/xylan/chitin deacetylase (PgdA/CDA1 family)